MGHLSSLKKHTNAAFPVAAVAGKPGGGRRGEALHPASPNSPKIAAFGSKVSVKPQRAAPSCSGGWL